MSQDVRTPDLPRRMMEYDAALRRCISACAPGFETVKNAYMYSAVTIVALLIVPLMVWVLTRRTYGKDRIYAQ